MNTTLLCITTLLYIYIHTTYVVALVHAPDGGLAALAPLGVLARCKKGQIKIIELKKNLLKPVKKCCHLKHCYY